MISLRSVWYGYGQRLCKPLYAPKSCAKMNVSFIEKTAWITSGIAMGEPG